MAHKLFTVDCGRRRLCSNRFGYKIEILKVYESGKKKGQEEWVEDRPAYPANLGHGLQMILERELKDGDDCTIAELPGRLEAGYTAVKFYMDEAEKLVKANG